MIISLLSDSKVEKLKQLQLYIGELCSYTLRGVLEMAKKKAAVKKKKK